MKFFYWFEACIKKQYVHTYMIYERKSKKNVKNQNQKKLNSKKVYGLLNILKWTLFAKVHIIIIY